MGVFWLTRLGSLICNASASPAAAADVVCFSLICRGEGRPPDPERALCSDYSRARRAARIPALAPRQRYSACRLGGQNVRHPQDRRAVNWWSALTRLGDIGLTAGHPHWRARYRRSSPHSGSGGRSRLTTRRVGATATATGASSRRTQTCDGPATTGVPASPPGV